VAEPSFRFIGANLAAFTHVLDRFVLYRHQLIFTASKLMFLVKAKAEGMRIYNEKDKPNKYTAFPHHGRDKRKSQESLII
jgi:hypothetical protein